MKKEKSRNISVRRQKIRYFILFEAATFILASLIHKGILVKGYAHYQAGIAENVIAGVLVIGLILSWIQPAWARISGIVVQGLAFFGTCIGVFTIIIGIGPRTVPDVSYHIFILIVLAWGIIFTKKNKNNP